MDSESTARRPLGHPRALVTTPATTPGVQRGWWFEDALAGGSIVHPGGRTITRDEHPLLASLTMNASEVHGNADRAARTAFGEPVVLGALSAAVVIGLAAPAGGGPRTLPGATLQRWQSIRLRVPVRPGDTLTAESRIEEARADSDRGGGLVERTISGRNQRGELVIEIRESVWAPARGGG